MLLHRIRPKLFKITLMCKSAARGRFKMVSLGEQTYSSQTLQWHLHLSYWLNLTVQPHNRELLFITILIYSHKPYGNILMHHKFACTQTYMQIRTQTKTHTTFITSLCHHKYKSWISGDLKADTREYSKLCVYEALFPLLLKHLLNCHSHLSNCKISFIFLLLCPEYESIMSCGCPPKLSLAPWNRFH